MFSFKLDIPVVLFELTSASPADQLACDQVLLAQGESGEGSAILRFWEPEAWCVILGYTNSAAREVNLDACRRRSIPVFRRTTGGGAVVQGPGCMNYSLILPINASPRFATAGGTNDFIMRRHADALQPFLEEAIAISGFSDLSIKGRKFCGNAQRRLQHWLLFHGCLLLNVDLELIGELLPMPSRQPVYRNGRPHAEFLRNIAVPAGDVRRALQTAWDARSVRTTAPMKEMDRLARERYANPAWTFK